MQNERNKQSAFKLTKFRESVSYKSAILAVHGLMNKFYNQKLSLLAMKLPEEQTVTQFSWQKLRPRL